MQRSVAIKGVLVSIWIDWACNDYRERTQHCLTTMVPFWPLLLKLLLRVHA